MSPVSCLIGMKSGHLAPVAVTILLLSLGLIFLSAQSAQVGASTVPSSWCYTYYGHYNMFYDWYYPYYYSYSYPYSYCYYGYYSSYYYGYPYSYYYTPLSKYQLTVATDPPNVGSVSGSGTYDQGTSASFSAAQNIVQVSQTARYVFSHWSGDYSGVGTSGTITMNSERKIIAVYQLQYYLDVGVQLQGAALPQGAGWYNAGATVTLSVAGQIFGGQDGSRLVFQGWSIDGKTIQAGVSLMLQMDSPHTVTAQYKQQYYLKVMTDRGVAFGEGWYDAGSTAQIYESTPVSTAYGVSIIFNGWQGDMQSNTQSSTVLMDKPKTVIASWRTDPTILNLTIAMVAVAIFLAGTGIIVYVVSNRNRSRQQTMTVGPTKAQIVTNPTSQAPMKHRFLRLWRTEKKDNMT
jgi:hypothetical protein